jgi:hypothetical protein
MGRSPALEKGQRAVHYHAEGVRGCRHIAQKAQLEAGTVERYANEVEGIFNRFGQDRMRQNIREIPANCMPAAGSRRMLFLPRPWLTRLNK